MKMPEAVAASRRPEELSDGGYSTAPERHPYRIPMMRILVTM
jgi:hypothetical protein